MKYWASEPNDDLQIEVKVMKYILTIVLLIEICIFGIFLLNACVKKQLLNSV